MLKYLIDFSGKFKDADMVDICVDKINRIVTIIPRKFEGDTVRHQNFRSPFLTIEDIKDERIIEDEFIKRWNMNGVQP